MSEAATKSTPPNAVAKLMDEGGITTVAVIDDVFAGPSVADYKPSEFEEFWAEIQYDDDALRELASVGISIKSPEDIGQGVLRSLINSRPRLPHLKPSVDKYFIPTFEAKLKPVTQLCDCLEKDLGRKLVKSDGMGNLNDPSIRLIFLDYFLEEGNQTESIRKARRIAEEIGQQYTKDPKPLILLMSSKPDITEDMVSSLRKGAKFLGSMFEFIPKEQFADTRKFVINLGCVAKSLKERQLIQHFAEGMENSVSGAAAKLTESVRGLSFEDYAYIQKLSLQREGHPLGDYISWMYSSYFGHLLFDTIPEQEALDGLTFSNLPARSFTPSSQFVEIYKNIVTEKVGPLTGHPLDERAAEADSPPLLHFGDVFLNYGGQVLMVITAECDLAFTPHEKSRPFDPERSVLLIRGTLSAQDPRVSHRLKTDFFVYKNETKRIVWQPKGVLSFPLREVREWLTKNGFIREARLRLPFALEVQQAFAADLTRIGMPVGPPIYEPASVEIACEGKERKIQVLSKLKDAAFVIRAREDEFVLSRTFIVNLGDVIDRAVEVLLEARKSQVDKGHPLQGYDLRIAEIQELKINFAGLLELAGPFMLPKVSAPLKNLPVEIYRNHAMDGTYMSKKALMFNIVDPNVAVAAESSAEQPTRAAPEDAKGSK